LLRVEDDGSIVDEVKLGFEYVVVREQVFEAVEVKQ